MIKINPHYQKLVGNYLFAEIAKQVGNYQKENPDKKVIKLGIGDVTRPFGSGLIESFKKAADDMGKLESFKGYKSDKGYDFLRQKIAEFDFVARGVSITPEDIFISTGAKEDSANIQELFDQDTTIAITDPVYPVYLDSNVMAGRTGEFKDGRYQNITYLDCTKENQFNPALPEGDVDLIYLCYPNNPTGQVATKEYLKQWVDYAKEKKALILFDAAYEAFITEDNIPHSIYEVEGADEVAVELRSLSKTAGFTGTRLSYTIIPEKVKIYDKNGESHSLSQLWDRRQATKFNGVAYIIQKGAEYVFTHEGRKEVNTVINYYMENARIIREGMDALNIEYTGGVNSPYIWLEAPGGMSSWDFFHKLLGDCQVVGTPGSGFGRCGEGYFRLSAFGNREDVKKAVERIKKMQL
jgi:LL-diaminopimelate aminotransferase